MITKLFKLLLMVSFAVPLQAGSKGDCCIKAKDVCSLIVRNCLRIWGNTTVEGNLAANSNVAVGGTFLLNGVSLNNLAGLAGAIGAAGATGAVGPAGAPGTPGIPGIGGVLGYAYACNTAAQAVAADGIVTFNLSTAPFLGITPPAPGGSTFIVGAAGVYRIQYHVRGQPGVLTGGTGPSAIQFEVTSNGDSIPCSIYASDLQTTALDATVGTEAVDGYTLVSLPAGAVLRLHNITRSSTDTVTLAAVPIGGTSAVNASMLIVRIA